MRVAVREPVEVRAPCVELPQDAEQPLVAAQQPYAVPVSIWALQRGVARLLDVQQVRHAEQPQGAARWPALPWWRPWLVLVLGVPGILHAATLDCQPAMVA